ncbi:MAG: hypothetical protein K6A70_09850 [Erysipelotrichaceae bacterium]|nr:hypothetical protein [Erysipelotrichaceae bacterium]
MKKILSFIFILFIVLALFGPVSISADEPAEDETINLIDTFFITTTGRYKAVTIPFNPKWFNDDARDYSHDLAKLSLGLATASFRPGSYAPSERDPDYNLHFFLYQAGFEDMRSDDYDKDPSKYTVSTMMGHRTINDGDDSYELIAVGICGQGYLDEWESNFSIGDGSHPEGFESAAQLVYDRVFGYISANHLGGKLKIWLSGFSRAAAIANITAARLTDSDMFASENVFAYTFATPNTVKKEDLKEYDNIFNVCGKMDPVTSIPFDEWGYTRYGTTFYTPTLETDTDFIKKRQSANVIYEDLTGIPYWNNANINSELRTIIGCLLRLCPTAEIYTQSLEDNLISLWEKHDAVSVFKKLLEMSEDPLLVNEKNRADANMLMNRFSYLLIDYVLETNSFRRYNAKASVGSNILQTHTPELYMSWIFSVDNKEDLYSDLKDYTEVYVEGETVVKLFRDEVLVDSYSFSETDVNEENRYLSLYDEQIKVLVPADDNYDIRITSNIDQTIGVMIARNKTGQQTPTMTTLAHYHGKVGEPINIRIQKGGDTNYVTTPDSAEMTIFRPDTYLSNSQFANFVYRNNNSASWRDMIMFIFMVQLILLCFVIFLVTLAVKYLRHVHMKKKGIIPAATRFRPLPIICFFLIWQLVLIKELYKILYDVPVSTMTSYEVFISLLLMLIAFYGYRRKKDRFHRMIMLAILVLCIGDIVLNYSDLFGYLVLILVNILLTYNYVVEDNPDRLQIIAWVVFSLINILLILRVPGQFDFLRFEAIIYAISGWALVCSSYVFPGRTYRGSLLLLVSGILYMINKLINFNVLLYAASVLCFYIAAITLASSGSGYTKSRSGKKTIVVSEEELISQ